MTHRSKTTGSCWDEAPFGPGQSNGLLCELPHGHKGAHRAGGTEWMIREEALNDDEQKALTKLLDDIDSGWLTGEARSPYPSEMAYELLRHGVGFHRPVMSEPQSEPSDAQVIAALNAYWEYDPPVTEVGYWSAKHASIMRAALRAASAATDREGNHG